MHNQNELDELFNEIKVGVVIDGKLKNPPMVNRNQRMSKSTSQRFPTLIAVAFIPVLILFFVLYFGVNHGPVQTVSSNEQQFVPALEIDQMFIAESVSTSNFTAIEHQLGTFHFLDIDSNIDIDKPEKILEKTLIQAYETTTLPTTNPLFDVHINTKEQLQLQFKLYVENDNLIIEDYKMKKYYETKYEDAMVLITIFNIVIKESRE